MIGVPKDPGDDFGLYSVVSGKPLKGIVHQGVIPYHLFLRVSLATVRRMHFGGKMKADLITVVQLRGDDGLNEVGFCRGDGEPASVLGVIVGPGKMTHFLGVSNSLSVM